MGATSSTEEQKSDQQELPSFKRPETSSATVSYADQNYGEIVTVCRTNKELFEDSLFPAENSSIYYTAIPQFDIEWLRPQVRKLQGEP